MQGFRTDISLQRIDLRLGIVHGALRHETRLVRFLGDLVQESRIVQCQAEPVRVDDAEVRDGDAGGFHVRSHGEVAGLFPRVAFGGCCFVCEGVAFSVDELADGGLLKTTQFVLKRTVHRL